MLIETSVSEKAFKANLFPPLIIPIFILLEQQGPVMFNEVLNDAPLAKTPLKETLFLGKALNVARWDKYV